MNTILTDDERPKLPEPRVPKDGNTGTWDKFSAAQMEAYADARESAVLAKLREQEPPPRFFYDEEDGLLFAPEESRPDGAIPLYTQQPAPLPAVVQVPQDREEWLAVREGHFNAASAEYFNARQHLDTPENRRIFYAGHCKGYDAAPLPAVVQVPQFDMEAEAKAIGLPPSIYAHPGVKQLVRAAIAAAPEAQPIPAPWREAVKVMREALMEAVCVTEWPELQLQASAALAQLDALEGGE